MNIITVASQISQVIEYGLMLKQAFYCILDLAAV